MGPRIRDRGATLMARVKLAGCSEAAQGGNWSSLTDQEKTDLIRMYPEAIRGTLEGMASASGRNFGDLQPGDVSELQRLRNSMRDTRERLLGVGVAVVGAPGLLDD